MVGFILGIKAIIKAGKDNRIFDIKEFRVGYGRVAQHNNPVRCVMCVEKRDLIHIKVIFSV